MTEEAYPFDEPTFEESAEDDGARQQRLDAEYGELFADSIADGQLGPEQRVRLDRAADMRGISRERVSQIELAIQAAYGARIDLPPAVVEVPEEIDTDRTPVDALAPFAEATDPRLIALQARIAFLEAETASLQFQLDAARHENEELRGQLALEMASAFSSRTREPMPSVDPISVVPVPSSSAPRDPAAIHRRYEQEPNNAELLIPLFHALRRAADLDRRVRVARTLVHLGAADAQIAEVASQHRTDVLPKPTRALAADDWAFLLHPEQELVPGAIFAIIAPVVLLCRFASMRASHAFVRLDPNKRIDPASTTVQAVRCFSWAAALLGLRTPPLYVDPEMPGLAEIVPDVQPATRIGAAALTRRTPRELAFLAGRHLASYREEHVVGTFVSSHRELEDLFLAGLVMVNPGLPMHAEVRGRVAPIVDSLRPLLQPAALERLRGLFLRFVEQGGRADLKRWTRASDLTAARAGLLLSDDLDSAGAMLHLEDASRSAARMADLLGFYTGDAATALRRRLGIAIVAE